MSVVANNLYHESQPDEINEEDSNTIFSYLRVLIDHLSCSGINTDASLSDGSAGKLTKLTVRHLMELASDMCDELDRRDIGSSLPLASKPELTAKRNNARIRMAEFSSEKLNNLILEVVQEIDRRKVNFPSFKNDPNVEETSSKKRVNSYEEPSKNESTSKKTKSSNESKNNGKSAPGPVPPIRSNPGGLNSAGLCAGIGIDSLDAMIEDLGSLIEKDGSEEFNELKQRYEAEIQQLKQIIEKYEKTIISEKNFEITRLMTKVEETELMNARLRRELSSLNEQLCVRDNMIQDQKTAYDILKESLENIQNQISNRVVDALAMSRNAARLELASSNILSDLNMHNDQITASFEGIENCMSSFNQKVFLKLLRDIATSAKSFVILFDRILQISTTLGIEEICTDGDNLKSEFISSLSSLLVSGKDFSARPQHSSEFKSCFETFKIANESLFDLKNRFENMVQNN